MENGRGEETGLSGSMESLARPAPRFRHATDLGKLRADIRKAAELAEVPYDEGVVERTFAVFMDFFCGSNVTFATNTAPQGKRRLAVRYVEFQVPHDPYAMALSAGLFKQEGHPIECLMRELQAKEDLLGYGTDLSVDYGIAKIWVFLRQHPEIEALCGRLPSLPAGVGMNLGFFGKHGLRHVMLIALDFRNHTINVYFMVKRPGVLSPDTVAAMLGESELRVPSREMLGYCAKASICYFTFSWDSTRIERACFCVTEEDESKIPTHLDPLLERYVRSFIYNITPTRDGVYVKIENDYVNSMIGMIERGIRLDPD
jgi:hypothetical protein